jgi:L-rhamnose mutarotase
MDNWLREFEELILDNVLLKVQNQTSVDNNPKWKKWWQIVQEIMDEQIQDSLEMVRVNEDAYLNELITY